MNNETELVIFRVYPDGDVIALFPLIAVDTLGGNCQSYMHVGQHGAANPNIVVSQTKLATPNQYEDLLGELKRIGYENLKIVKRFRYWHQEERQKQIKEIRG